MGCGAVARSGLAVLAVVLALGVGGAQASGGDIASEVARQVAGELVSRGYSDVTVSWTWLGRLRVTGVIDGRAREIILHPTSGEVLRDFLAPAPVLTAGGDGGSDDGGQAAAAVSDGAAVSAGVAALGAPVAGDVPAAAGAEPALLDGVTATVTRDGAGGK